MTQSGKVIVSGLTTLNAGANAITLNNSGNSFGTLELTGTTVSINEAGATDLGTTGATTLTVTSRYDAGRAALSDAVGLEAPAVRLTT